MRPELNREYPELDDPQTFEHMAQLTAAHMRPILGHLRRAQHAKATGCVTAKFRIADDVPPDLRHGVFRNPGRVFDAVVRFSNSKNKFEKDSVGDARGLAIKLLDVQGTRAMAGDLDTTQDFLMVNHPVFPFPDPKAYVEAMSRGAAPLIGGELLIAAHLALFEPAEFKVVQTIRHKTVSSPLEICYWSGTPFWLGPTGGEGGHAVKYSVEPFPPVQATSPERPERLPNDFLTEALARHLQSGEALFNFRVQLQTDPVAMPVEDVSVEWSETDSLPVSVAMLRIGMQSVDGASDLATKCESMSFNPWHALAEHRPMGGMNRLRKVVYQASVAKRAETAIGA
jgi:hypothetical protein